MARVVVAMSGGVDSSVAAALLQEQGHEVIGLFMRHGHSEYEPATSCASGLGGCDASSAGETPSDASSRMVSLGAGPQLAILPARPNRKQGCCSVSDAMDARRVADRLGVPFYAVDFQEQFDQIIDYFVAEYTIGRTPNPCVMCNNWLKFGKLLEYADSVGADWVATGHYARIVENGGRPQLARGRDADKDQSYVLFGVTRAALDRIRFPVGDFCKAEIRERARQIGLRVADKQDSQEICFVPDGDYASLVRRKRGEVDLAGEIVTTDGTVVGHHTGIENYTIGQRKGLGVAFGEPRYVVRLEIESRRVVIGTRDDLARDELWADRTNWHVELPADSITTPVRCQVQIRYNADPTPAVVTRHEGNRLHVKFDEPRHGVAPGQAVVCYDDDRVVGGGWIC